MATFKWRDLTITVGEMSRTTALECARQFDLLAKVYTDYIELTREADVLAVLYAPVTVKVKETPFNSGTQTIEVEGRNPFDLTLPLTREGFYSLPMSLSEVWVNAAVTENGWFVDVLKKVFSLTSPNGSEPKSGSEPLTEPSLTV